MHLFETYQYLLFERNVREMKSFISKIFKMLNNDSFDYKNNKTLKRTDETFLFPFSSKKLSNFINYMTKKFSRMTYQDFCLISEFFAVLLNSQKLFLFSRLLYMKNLCFSYLDYEEHETLKLIIYRLYLFDL